MILAVVMIAGIMPRVEAQAVDELYSGAVERFDDKSITWSIAFIHQDYEKLGAAAKKFIAYIIDHVK